MYETANGHNRKLNFEAPDPGLSVYLSNATKPACSK